MFYNPLLDGNDSPEQRSELVAIGAHRLSGPSLLDDTVTMFCQMQQQLEDL
jgi:hypothetical protein